MNRRNFFKVVTGFVAGVFAAAVPKAKGFDFTPNKCATEVQGRHDNGLKEAFCYGGKLFRVYNLGCYKILQLKHNKWINNVQIDSYQFLNREYRNMVCEAMLKSLERTLKQV